jgi:TPR repeat protein
MRPVTLRPGNSALAAAALIILACAGAEPRKQAWDVKPTTSASALPPQLADRLELLEANCAASNASTCVEIGRLYEAGAGGLPRDLRRAERGYARGCSLGSGEACRHLERLVEADDTTPPDLGMVEATLRAACERGTSDACVGLATMHLQAIGVPEAPEQARKLLARACDANNGVACMRLGLILVAFPQEMDLDPGLRLLERGCALGTQLSCVRSADRLLRAGWERNGSWWSGVERAVDRLRAACRAGEYAGCVAVGALYLDGRGVGRDPAKAREIFRAACDDGFARGCDALGGALADAPGARAEAAAAWRRACQLRDGGGCLRLAQSLHALPGGPPDAAPAQGNLAAAVRLVQQACTLHAPEGCATLAALHQRGLGVPRDARRAAELGLRACRLGAEVGCERTYLSRALR